jgi:hypothetical protein
LLVATTVYFFTIVNYIKLVPYAWLGLLEKSNLSTSLLLAPVIPLGYWIGWKFTRSIPEKPFYTFINLTLIATGIKLLWDGLVGPVPQSLAGPMEPVFDSVLGLTALVEEICSGGLPPSSSQTFSCSR